MLLHYRNSYCKMCEKDGMTQLETYRHVLIEHGEILSTKQRRALKRAIFTENWFPLALIFLVFAVLILSVVVGLRSH